MKIAKRVFMFVILAALIVPVVGCGVGITPAENRRAALRVIDYDARQFVDDSLLFLQLDRPTRTSRWVID